MLRSKEATDIRAKSCTTNLTMVSNPSMETYLSGKHYFTIVARFRVACRSRTFAPRYLLCQRPSHLFTYQRHEEAKLRGKPRMNGMSVIVPTQQNLDDVTVTLEILHTG